MSSTAGAAARDRREGQRMRRRLAMTAIVLGFLVAALAVVAAVNPGLVTR
jgi:hypothetical protein